MEVKGSIHSASQSVNIKGLRERKKINRNKMSTDIFMNVLGTRPKGVLILCWILCVISCPNTKFQENWGNRVKTQGLFTQNNIIL